MKLFTSLPARKDGTLIVTTDDGTKYVFKGEPLSYAVDDEDHADELQAKGFQTQDEFEAEQVFQKQLADREARRAARGLPSNAGASAAVGDSEDDLIDTGTGAPQEGNAAPTGRVRRAASSSAVIK